MSIVHSVALGFLSFWLFACASASEGADRPTTPKTPIQGGIAEFSPTLFDGETLEGRLLVGATVTPFVLDTRLLEYVDVELRNIRACGTGERLGSYLFDIMVPVARDDQKVKVEVGYWYGAKVNFHLFDKLRMKLLPQCFEADLWVWSLDRRVITKHPISVRRTGIAADAPLKQPETP